MEYGTHGSQTVWLQHRNRVDRLSRYTHHLSHKHCTLIQHIMCSAGETAVYKDSWGNLRCHSLSIYNLHSYHFYCMLQPISHNTPFSKLQSFKEVSMGLSLSLLMFSICSYIVPIAEVIGEQKVFVFLQPALQFLTVSVGMKCPTTVVIGIGRFISGLRPCSTWSYSNGRLWQKL